MKRTLTVSDIAHELIDDEYNNFSYHGAYALAEWLDENMEEEAEFCPVETRCEYCQYKSLEAFAEEYSCTIGDKISTFAAEDQREDAIREFIHDNGILIEFDGGIIVSSF